jgi:hypothetical protein
VAVFNHLPELQKELRELQKSILKLASRQEIT